MNFITHFCHDGVRSQYKITNEELLFDMEANKGQLSIESVVQTIRNKREQTKFDERERLSQSLRAAYMNRKQTQNNN